MSGEMSTPLIYIEMPTEKEIICLANSIKNHPCRCVAGIDIETGEWIRPVSEKDSGELTESHYTTEQGHDPAPLNMLRVYLGEPAPAPSQPENWTLANRDWQLIRESPRPKHYQTLVSALESGPELFGNTERAVSLGTEVNNSLALVKPENATLRRKPRRNKGDQPRLQFELEDVEYDFPITGPRVKEKIFDIVDHAGKNPLDDHIASDNTPLITVSLGEEFNGEHWKLVAAIFSIPQTYL